jgi:hypothetical protein
MTTTTDKKAELRVLMEPELYEGLRDLAKSRHMPMSLLVRLMIIEQVTALQAARKPSTVAPIRVSYDALTAAQ